MLRKWVRSSGDAVGGSREGPSTATELSCTGLARALKRILADKERPEVLVLGESCASSAVYLADRGARVCVDAIDLPDPVVETGPGSTEGEEAEEQPPLVIAQPDRKFDLVLAWDHGDFVPPERLGEFGAEVARILAPGGWFLMFAQDRAGDDSASHDRPGRYRLTADDRMVRTVGEEPEQPRWTHPNRRIEAALAPLSVESIHLQRNRVREFLLRKPAPRPEGRRTAERESVAIQS